MKYKVSDRVVTHKFKGADFNSRYMNKYIGIEGIIEVIHTDKDLPYEVHNWWWPESALTPVEEKVDDMNEDIKEFLAFVCHSYKLIGDGYNYEALMYDISTRAAKLLESLK